MGKIPKLIETVEHIISYYIEYMVFFSQPLQYVK